MRNYKYAGATGELKIHFRESVYNNNLRLSLFYNTTYIFCKISKRIMKYTGTLIESGILSTANSDISFCDFLISMWRIIYIFTLNNVLL